MPPCVLEEDRTRCKPGGPGREDLCRYFPTLSSAVQRRPCRWVRSGGGHRRQQAATRCFHSSVFSQGSGWLRGRRGRSSQDRGSSRVALAPSSGETCEELRGRPVEQRISLRREPTTPNSPSLDARWQKR